MRYLSWTLKIGLTNDISNGNIGSCEVYVHIKMRRGLMMNVKRNIIKLVVFTCSFAAFVGSSFAANCNAPMPQCVIVHSIKQKEIKVQNTCDVKVALQIKGENAWEVGTHIRLTRPNNKSVFTMGPPTPKNPALPASYSGLSCCPGYGEGYGCPQKQRKGNM